MQRFNIGKLLRWLVMALLAALFLLPIYLMLVVSLKSSSESLSGLASLSAAIPTLGNYAHVFKIIPYGRYMWNTLVIAGLSVLGQLIVCPMVAYSISKVHWFGAKPITALLFGTLMLPYFTIMVPLYKQWSMLGLTGTPWPLILCNLFGNSFYIIIIRQFMLGMPDSMLEAVSIDGCSEWQKYWYIMLPLSKAPMATIAILSFVANWSDYLSPMLYLSKKEDYTLSLGLYSFIGQHSVDWTLLMAAAAIFVLPAMLVFIFFQKYFVQGIATTGMKS